MKSKSRAILFGVISLIFFLSGFKFLGAIFLSFSLLGIYSFLRNPNAKILSEISKEASLRHFSLDIGREAQEKLISLYKLYFFSLKKYPMLKEEYQNLLQSFWDSSFTPGASLPFSLKEKIQYYIDHWPLPSSEKPFRSQEEAFKRAQKACYWWDEAAKKSSI